LLREQMGVEGERSGNVRGEVGGIVAPRIEMKFVWNLAGSEDFVERGGAGVEAVIVLIAAVEINLQAGKIRGPRQH
jgi:hypothetical protein